MMNISLVESSGRLCHSSPEGGLPNHGVAIETFPVPDPAECARRGGLRNAARSPRRQVVSAPPPDQGRYLAGIRQSRGPQPDPPGRNRLVERAGRGARGGISRSDPRRRQAARSRCRPAAARADAGQLQLPPGQARPDKRQGAGLREVQALLLLCAGGGRPVHHRQADRQPAPGRAAVGRRYAQSADLPRQPGAWQRG